MCRRLDWLSSLFRHRHALCFPAMLVWSAMCTLSAHQQLAAQLNKQGESAQKKHRGMHTRGRRRPSPAQSSRARPSRATAPLAAPAALRAPSAGEGRPAVVVATQGEVAFGVVGTLGPTIASAANQQPAPPCSTLARPPAAAALPIFLVLLPFALSHPPDARHHPRAYPRPPCTNSRISRHKPGTAGRR